MFSSTVLSIHFPQGRVRENCPRQVFTSVGDGRILNAAFSQLHTERLLS